MAGAWGWRPHHLHVLNVMKIWEPKPPGTLWATAGLLRDDWHPVWWRHKTNNVVSINLYICILDSSMQFLPTYFRWSYIFMIFLWSPETNQILCMDDKKLYYATYTIFSLYLICPSMALSWAETCCIKLPNTKKELWLTLIIHLWKLRTLGGYIDTQHVD